MTVAGIIAEYNPFHTGHAYQIARTREALGEETAVAAVMSGNWVQQANCSITDKWTRAKLALMGGVDLVLELPTVWAMSSAESFARGAAEILDATGVVDVLSFGSECGDVDKLRRVAACLDSSAYRVELHRFMDEGMSFAACRQAAVRELLGDEPSGLLSLPNNNLGVEYIRALIALKSSIQPMTVQRRGAAHNSISAAPAPTQFVSATQIRCDLMNGQWERVGQYMVPCGRDLLRNDPAGLSDLRRIERAILARVRTMKASEWAELPDSGSAEGLPQRLERAGRQCASIKEFFDLAKTKRYSHARLRRLTLWAFLGLRSEDRPEHPLYIRVLGFNERGREVLGEMKRRAVLPIITKPAHARELDSAGHKLFELEARCTDLYNLCFEKVGIPGREWLTGPVRMEDQRGQK